jgi:methionyl-tRNA synthetase
MMRDALADFGIAFDHYSRTSSEAHHKVASDFFKTLYDKGVFEARQTDQYYDPEAEQFLADRYITGTCPRCSHDAAYGDQCEQCGATLNPTDLINPHSTLSGATPVLKATTNWFLPLDKLSDDLRRYITSHPEWKPNVYGQTLSWLDAGDGLQPRSMTRDLDWGVPVPVPGAREKYSTFGLTHPWATLLPFKNLRARTGKPGGRTRRPAWCTLSAKTTSYFTA